MTTVGDVRDVLETAYPPHLAESWDAVGLVCGDPVEPVRKIALALDCTQAVAEAAVEAGADMLITHHPLLMRGVTSVAADTPKGKVVHTLIRNKVALFAAHTNADSARPGVNDKLAELVGITPGRPIKPKLDTLEKWGIQVPHEHADAVKQAVFEAGAGNIGDYSECTFHIEGTGQFRSSVSANPAIGERGELTELREVRIEFVAPPRRRNAIIDALRSAHPYEEPAFDVVSMQPTGNLDEAYGLGRVGELAKEMRFADFVQQVADALPETVWGVRGAGDPEKMVKTVAVSSGSGDSFLADAAALGVDVYVTSDLRHHPVDEHLRAGGPMIVDTAHWASEYPWTQQAAEILSHELPEVEVEVLSNRTDPWTVSAHPRPSADKANEDRIEVDGIVITPRIG